MVPGCVCSGMRASGLIDAIVTFQSTMNKQSRRVFAGFVLIKMKCVQVVTASCDVPVIFRLESQKISAIVTPRI